METDQETISTIILPILLIQEGPQLSCMFVLRFYSPVNQQGHVERSQFSQAHFYWADLVL